MSVKLGLTLCEEHVLRDLANRMLSGIRRPIKEDVTRKLMELHNEELHILYSSQILLE
jgi:hypothetical protein